MRGMSSAYMASWPSVLRDHSGPAAAPSSSPVIPKRAASASAALRAELGSSLSAGFSAGASGSASRLASDAATVAVAPHEGPARRVLAEHEGRVLTRLADLRRAPGGGAHALLLAGDLAALDRKGARVELAVLEPEEAVVHHERR